MEKRKINYKNILKNSMFGELFMLWTAPLDKPRVVLSTITKQSNITNNWFPNNLIIAHRP